MVTNTQREFILFLIKIKIFGLKEQWRCARVHTKGWLSQKIYEWLLRRQTWDDLHHAPCCPANHWGKQALVFKKCTCGATKETTENDK